MLPKYTHALGGTERIKELLEELNTQYMVMENIASKLKNKESYAI